MNQTNQIPDAYFYYGLSVALAVALIAVLRWVGARLVANLDRQGNDINELKAGQQLLTQVLQGQNEDLNQIKQRVFLDPYKKQGK